MTATAARRTSLDVLRGMAVLVMIEAHVIDSWTREADRHSRAFGESLILGGFGAPLFLFLAGVAVAMSAGSKARRWNSAPAAASAVAWRGSQILALAFLFRFQSVVLSHAPAWTLLRVDVLNVMGPSIVAAAGLWLVGREMAGRLAIFGVSTLALVLIAPAIRHASLIGALPDALEAYVRPVPGLSNFTFFPWAAFVTAGAMLGVLLDAARTPASDRRLNLSLIAVGLGVVVAAYLASFRAPIDPRSSFWTTSASFFFLRVGVMVAATGIAWLWEQRPGRENGWSPLQLLGRSSLFVYWIHVELVYGLVSNPLHGAFSLSGAWGALAAFSLLMVGAAALKTMIVRKYRARNNLRDKLDRPVQPLMF